MPSLYRDKSSPYYRIRFRWQGQEVHRSLRTKNKTAARATCDRVGEMLDLVERGLMSIPPTTDSVTYLLTDGRVKKSATRLRSLSLAAFFRTYQKKLPAGSKEESTLKGERLHVRHFKKHLGANRTMQSITKADLQTYVSRRLEDTHRGKTIRPDTIRKELVTFRMLWNWGVEEGLILGRAPTRGIALPLVDEKPPFMTRDEIESIVKRGGVSDEELAELWKSLFLERQEINDFLDHVKSAAISELAYPLMVFVAHTGARRSEIVRSRIEDFDFRAGTVMLREKKKSRTKAVTYRRVDISPLLEKVLRQWIENHTGGQHNSVVKNPL